MISVTVTGDDEVVAMLGKASLGVIRETPKVIDKGLLNIKKEARGRISGNARWRGLTRTINYDKRGPFKGEVGYDKGGQGNLGNIAEFGSAHHAPHPALVPASEAEAPKMEQALSDLVARLTA